MSYLYPSSTEVAIIGAGPSGVVAASLLKQQKEPCCHCIVKRRIIPVCGQVSTCLPPGQKQAAIQMRHFIPLYRHVSEFKQQENGVDNDEN